MRFAVTALLLIPTAVFADANGISAYSGKQGGTFCTSCHTGGTPPSVALTGPATLGAGQTASYTVTISGGAATASGLDVALGGAAAAGATLVPGPGTKLLNGELTHTAPGTFTAGVATFTFSLIAGPTGGNMVVYVAGVSGNGSNTPLGDNADSLTRTVTVTGSVVPDAGTVPPAADAGTTPPPVSGGPPAVVAVAPKSNVPQGGFVEGDVGCSATGGLPAGILLAAWALVASRRRR